VRESGCSVLAVVGCFICLITAALVLASAHYIRILALTPQIP